MDCEKLYENVIAGTNNDSYSLFELAECFASGYDGEKLRAMLKSTDLGIVSDGLFIVAEIGSLAKKYTNELEILLTNNDDEIKRSAKKLFEIYTTRNSGDTIPN